MPVFRLTVGQNFQDREKYSSSPRKVAPKPGGCGREAQWERVVQRVVQPVSLLPVAGGRRGRVLSVPDREPGREPGGGADAP
ncbi:hypothetical protein ACFFX0_08855 [Citricoccus parietis]|uniref:Uncharacterized protein n=1 Tax=Citricoccus parietis TaxID=592307 RepID=A0ABV5FXZ6_9MICC